MTDEQRAERLHWHMYESNEGIREHAERIVALEELVEEMLKSDVEQYHTEFIKKAEALGIVIEWY